MNRRNRLVFLDALRGVAIILMVINHTSRWWIGRPMGWPRYWLVYGSMLLPATLFLFLVGFCLPMPFRSRPLPPIAEALPRYARRGLTIILWGYVLNVVVFNDFLWGDVLKLAFFHDDEPLWGGGVLHTIGASVILTAPLMWVVRRTASRVAVLAIAVLGYVAFVHAEPMLAGWTKAHVVPGEILFFDFPLWPWLAAPLIGLVAGMAWLDARSRGEADEHRFFAAIAAFGGACLLWYAVWEWWVRTTPRFGFARDFVLNGHWTPRGASVALILGASAILLALVYWLGEVQRLRMRWLVILGQTALVLYFVHQIVAYTIVKQALGVEFHTWKGYWLANAALMLGLLGFAWMWLAASARVRAWRASRPHAAAPAG